jgi:rubrerythrin
MNVFLNELVLVFRRSTETISLKQINYFYGQMGAGKSSIARLIDYCLGGRLDYTPALQIEFISATLNLVVSGKNLILQRNRDSDQIHAQWHEKSELLDIIIPARSPREKPNNIIIPNTEVEVLSDLIFYLIDHRPPRVRRSKNKEDSELERLSLRDLLWYCYLDQDTFDSSFYNLDRDADTFKRLKSRDVLRFVIGFHQESVTELEVELETLRSRRTLLIESHRVLNDALKDTGIGSESEIDAKILTLRERKKAIEQQIEDQKKKLQETLAHSADKLREKGRSLGHEVQSLEEAIIALQETIENESQHLNELQLLTVKIRRDVSARAVLAGVEFEACPRCAQSLPKRHEDICPVCGQTEPVIEVTKPQDSVTQDVQDRQAELKDILARRKNQLTSLSRRKDEFQKLKWQVDAELNAAVKAYDSAYLSSNLQLERDNATINAEIENFINLRRLPKLSVKQIEEAESLAPREEELKRQLREAREAAEKDKTNLKRLERLFLECLIRAKLDGFSVTDTVQITSPWFLPVVISSGEEEMLSSSFANLGSGGKKTLFKACFSLAIHRLAVEIGAILPTLLIIDSPMKNISERENLEQFEGFHQLLYELASDELSQTQFILIDKEFLPPSDALNLDFQARHMKPNDPIDKPLISYFNVSQEPIMETVEPQETNINTA